MAENQIPGLLGEIGEVEIKAAEHGTLKAELELIKRRGWADAYEEREHGLNAIAAPVWANDGELAGIVALQVVPAAFTVAT